MEQNRKVDFYPIPNKNTSETEGLSSVLPNGIPERYFATSGSANLYGSTFSFHENILFLF